jgi:hypothetical protein
VLALVQRLGLAVQRLGLAVLRLLLAGLLRGLTHLLQHTLNALHHRAGNRSGHTRQLHWNLCGLLSHLHRHLHHLAHVAALLPCTRGLRPRG